MTICLRIRTFYSKLVIETMADVRTLKAIFVGNADLCRTAVTEELVDHLVHMVEACEPKHCAVFECLQAMVASYFFLSSRPKHYLNQRSFNQ